MGRTGLSGGYQQWEAEEKVAANRYRAVAIGLGLATAIVIGLFGFIRADRAARGHDLDWEVAVSGLALPSALGGVAAYAGREAAKHRRNQVIARRTELELASFPAYLADLPREEQRQLFTMFAPVFFGQAATMVDKEVDGGPQVMQKDLVDQVAQRLKKPRG